MNVLPFLTAIELGGTVFLFLGFIYSDRFIKAREALVSEAREKRGIE